ncbi:Glycosyltransferase, GT2 family [Mesonia phycicola]|uniref:Glycosyltransferase, GT2 family n=1 Tax=Mesonia phycicola TaxID=579105 RepID=A0A1M6AMR6_9FLAO|nr:glycosyltransferase family 2 protein [Mesonia phycicola]SHI37790.1 Glycosyltransferase, GT2 family [Mesonia phycicola]
MLSVIIVTYNGMKWLAKCLASIPKEYNMVIVDNNSTDTTVQFIEQNYPQAKLFKEKENLGFGQANNKGISYALQQGAKYVYLLNQDAYLEADTIDKLVKVHQSQPSYGILSPIHINAEKTRLDAGFSLYVSYKHNPHFYSDFVLQKSKQEVYEVPFVNAAGWLVSREVLLNVGGFDPIFFHYGEDDNYTQRVRYHNFKVGVVSNSFMVHDREDRVLKKLRYGSEAYFKQREKELKVKYANINNPNVEEYNRRLAKTNKNYIQQLMFLKFKNAKKHKEMYRFLLRIKAEIENSLIKNKKLGSWYLNV